MALSIHNTFVCIPLITQHQQNFARISSKHPSDMLTKRASIIIVVSFNNSWQIELNLLKRNFLVYFIVLDYERNYSHMIPSKTIFMKYRGKTLFTIPHEFVLINEKWRKVGYKLWWAPISKDRCQISPLVGRQKKFLLTLWVKYLKEWKYSFVILE